MAQLINFGEKLSLEQYIKSQVCVNNGASTRITNSMLQKILDECGAAYKKTALKEELLNLIFDQYKDWYKVGKMLNVGVKVNQYTAAFPFVTNADIKRLEKFGQIKVIGTEQFRAFGKYKHATLYDLKQFLNMTEQDMRKLLELYPKGMRLQKSQA